MKALSLQFMVEKREGLGEDSDPLTILKEKFCVSGVLDGMGGAGATECKSDFGDTHTKAYVASRIIQKVLWEDIDKAEDLSRFTSEHIKEVIQVRFEEEKKRYPSRASRLRSNLIRDYPTTLALLTAEEENEEGNYTIRSYWAGDSRNYLWTSEGFFQVSQDDLTTPLDPLQNLRQDAPMSNCLCADRDFTIHTKEFLHIASPCILISATDGCFGYFSTPMHFEHLLREGLQQTQSIDEWEKHLKEEIGKVTADDISLSLIILGVEEFQEIKNLFPNTHISGIGEIKLLETEVFSLKEKLKQTQEALEEKIQKHWEEYKIGYMRYLMEEETSVEPQMPVEKKEAEEQSEEKEEEKNEER